MRVQSSKERVYWRSPRASIVLAALLPDAEPSSLAQAVLAACGKHEILSCHLEQDGDGTLWYVTGPKPTVRLEKLEGTDWRAAMLAASREPLDPAGGTLVRAAYLREPEGLRLLLTLHHLGGDGQSAACLLADILRGLTGPVGEPLPLRLFDPGTVPPSSRPRLPLRLMAGGVNRRWRKSGRIFNEGEYGALRARYWRQRNERLETASLDCLPLLAACRREGVHVTAALLAALLGADGGADAVGVTVSLREAGDMGMGNYSTGVTVKGGYDPALGFFGNARRLGDGLKTKLEQPKEKYFLHHFMGLLAPTLIDGAYFSAYGGDQDPTAAQAAKLFGWGADTGLSLSNLGRLALPGVSELYFLSPLMPGTGRMVSAVTAGDRLSLCCQYAAAATEPGFLGRAVEILKQAGETER